jgi:hypothetical protein
MQGVVQVRELNMAILGEVVATSISVKPVSHLGDCESTNWPRQLGGFTARPDQNSFPVMTEPTALHPILLNPANDFPGLDGAEAYACR